MFRKLAIIWGLIFLVGRIALCVLFAVLHSINYGSGKSAKVIFVISLFLPFAIVFAFGAISDLALVYGAWKKNVTAIHVRTHHMFSRFLNPRIYDFFSSKYSLLSFSTR